MRTGCQWRQLPKDFPPWKTVYSCNSRLKKSGIWQEIHDFLVKKGYDAGKKIKGRKRHIIVDTVGLVIAAEVHSASIQDRDSALNLFAQAKCKVPTLRKFFADQGYIGKLQNRCLLETGCLLTIAKKIVDTGFQVIPKRWIVERTFAWLSNFRRMSKDYEHSPLTSKPISSLI
ncbi:IS5 family transposase [Trichonephila inaurata madagascariensis]|uniref:IS5 family transposase n=1 Tax=Trichonephila inaurata madagascariensis TaxID=2747483 RepID=A0A8X7CBH0_9ARAC|nr:IS5 family transposase [Trichonephila inaurata madagascariensis]